MILENEFAYRNFLTFLNDDPIAETIPKQWFIDYLKHRREKRQAKGKDAMDICSARGHGRYRGQRQWGGWTVIGPKRRQKDKCNQASGLSGLL